jgi:hypothetical protein
MSAFTHWTYIKSEGKSLICDLQGVGPILTDPQIIDVDETRWADGNNSMYGIKLFLKDHVCNELCKSLKFTKPVAINTTVPLTENEAHIQHRHATVPSISSQYTQLSSPVPSLNLPHARVLVQSVQVSNAASSSKHSILVNRGSLAHLLHPEVSHAASSSSSGPPENTGT